MGNKGTKCPHCGEIDSFDGDKRCNECKKYLDIKPFPRFEKKMFEDCAEELKESVKKCIVSMNQFSAVLEEVFKLNEPDFKEGGLLGGQKTDEWIITAPKEDSEDGSE